MLTKGRTQIATRGAADAVAALLASVFPGGAEVPRAARCWAIIEPSARSNSWNGTLAGSSAQSSSSVVWIARTSIGSFAPSNRTGTRMPRSAASRASPRTQREATEVWVQTTIAAQAASSSLSIWLSNSCPVLIAESHQTVQPCASIAATRAATRALSVRE